MPVITLGKTMVKKLLIYGVIIFVSIFADQVSKNMILQHLQYMERVAIIPGFFDLILVYNTGAAFSFLAGAGGWQKFFFIGLALIICIFLLKTIIRDELGKAGKIAAAMIIGGALGNVIDRLIYGHVVDFILLYYHNWFYPAFNIADSCICVGAVLLVLESIFHQKIKSSKFQS